MGRNIAKSLLLLVPTLFGIVLIDFVVVQSSPGGPIEQIVAQITCACRVGGRDTSSNGLRDGPIYVCREPIRPIAEVWEEWTGETHPGRRFN